MGDVQWARLAEIEKRFQALGLTQQWIDTYMENRPLYPIQPEKAMTPDGRMIMLPPGTLPDYVFFETLNTIIRNMETARKNAIQTRQQVYYPSALTTAAATTTTTTTTTTTNTQGDGAAATNTSFPDSSANLDVFQYHICSFYAIQNDLHVHISKYKPIKALEFLEEVNNLIDEKLRILAIYYTSEGISLTAKQLFQVKAPSSSTKNFFP
jgi:hypothetical protein